MERASKWIAKRWIPCASLILLLHLALMASFAWNHSATYDEPVHICGGLERLKAGVPGICMDRVFPIVWCALPVTELQFPKDPASLEQARQDENSFSTKILFAEGVDSHWVLFKARMMVSLFSVGFGILLLLAARRLAGTMPALFTLCLYALSPAFISNGALATSDMSLTFLLFAAAWAFWSLFRRMTPGKLLCCMILLPALCLSKLSGLLIFPCLLLFLALRTVKGKTEVGLPFLKPFSTDRPLKKLLLCSCALVPVALACLAAAWLAYGNLDQKPFKESLASTPISLDEGVSRTGAKILARTGLLPAAYLTSLTGIYDYTQKARWSYLNGQTSFSGFKSFFIKVFLIKTQPAVLIALCLGLVWLFMELRSGRPGRLRMAFLTPFAILSAVYMTAAIASSLNFGVRHLLPATPLAFLLCALGFRLLGRFDGKYTLAKFLPFLLILCSLIEDVKLHPSYMTYITPFAGGPANGPKLLVDSSFDWGQDLTNIKPALKRHGIDPDSTTSPLYLSYSGTCPLKECGFKFTPAKFSDSNGKLIEFKGGIYCMSALSLMVVNNPAVALLTNDDALRAQAKRLFLEAVDRQAKGVPLFAQREMSADDRKLASLYQDCCFETLRWWMKDNPPDFTAGNSILIFKLSDEDVRKILGELAR